MAEYKIQSGDTLSKIAASSGTTVDAIMKANPSIKNANQIQAGASLVLPGQSTTGVNQSLAPAPMSRVSSTNKALPSTVLPGALDSSLYGQPEDAGGFRVGTFGAGSNGISQIPTPQFNQTIPEVSPELREIQMKAMRALSEAGVDIDTITKRLFEESGTVSSATSEIGDFVKKAIDYQEQAQRAGRESITGEFATEEDYMVRELEDRRRALLEKSIGGGDVSPLAIESLDRNIERSLRDLETRKQSAIAQNDANAYKTISDLMMSELQFRTQARQQAFERMLGISNFGQKKFDYVQAVSDMATKMSDTDLQRAINLAQLEVSRANTIADVIYKNGQLRATELSMEYKNGGEFPGWYNRDIAIKGIAQVGAKRDALVGEMQKKGVSSREMFTSLFEDASRLMQNYHGAADPQAILSAYGFQDNGNGNPVFYLGPNKWLQYDGSITKTPQFVEGVANTQPVNERGFLDRLSDYFDLGMKGGIFGTGQMFGSWLSEGTQSALDKLRANAMNDEWKKAQQMSTTTPKELSWAEPGNLLGTMLGVKTAYASDGTEGEFATEGSTKSFFESLIHSIDNRFNKPVVYNASDKAPRMPVSESSLHPMVREIAKNEGYYAASNTPNRPQRNNNPGNLKYMGQPGTVGKDKDGFAIFDSIDAGWSALQNQIFSAVRGTSSVYHPEMTLVDFFKKYAPAADKNNPTKYAANVASALGVKPTAKLKDILK